MPALMRYRLVLVPCLIAVLAVFGACGKEIGDACVLGTDCSQNGDRLCDPSSVDGYCTIQGCDVDTCPDEAVCVRFFTGSFSNKLCDYYVDNVPEGQKPRLCSLDELCALDGVHRENDKLVDGHCVARSSEVRYCMRKCGSDGDCRGDSDDDGKDDYECRNLDRMIAHGGEPVLGSDTVVDERAPKFCAAAPPP
jgi:hypothetical protein